MIRAIRTMYLTYVQLYKPVKHANIYIEKISNGFREVLFSSKKWIATLGDFVVFIDESAFILYRKKNLNSEVTKPIELVGDFSLGMSSVFLHGINVEKNVIMGVCTLVSRDKLRNSVIVWILSMAVKPVHDYLIRLERESLRLGHRKDKEKDSALKVYYEIYK